MAKATNSAPAAEKVDLCKLHKIDYSTPKTPQFIETTPAHYLAIQGQGEPGGEDFTARIGAIYNVAYTIKMTYKFAGRGDYKVCPLEAVYWTDGPDPADIAAVPRADWHWKFLIRTPDWIGAPELEAAHATLIKRKKGPLGQEVKLESLAEGRCVQMLHVGPYSTECETIAKMEEFTLKAGLAFHGLHHEIYLSDPHRVAPEKLKTILRMPVK